MKMKMYRVYEACLNIGGGVEGCGCGDYDYRAGSAQEAAQMAARDWQWDREDWDGGDVIVATDDDDDVDSYHLHRTD